MLQQSVCSRLGTIMYLAGAASDPRGVQDVGLGLSNDACPCPCVGTGVPIVIARVPTRQLIYRAVRSDGCSIICDLLLDAAYLTILLLRLKDHLP